MEQSKTEEDNLKEYNQIVEDKKSTEGLDISDAAFKIALSAGRSDVFPPFGIISFNNEERTNDQLADQTIKGTQSFYDNILVKEKTENLIDNPAIIESSVFGDSKSVQELQAKTKTEFSKILDSYHEKEDSNENIDKKNTKNIESLDTDSIKKILSSTMSDFLKEIGVKRNESEKDDLIAKQSGENIIKRLEEKPDIPTESKNNTKTEISSIVSSIVPNFSTDVKVPLNNIISNNTNNAITSSSVTPLININSSTSQKPVTNNSFPSISSTQTSVNNISNNNTSNNLQNNSSGNISGSVTSSNITSILPSVTTPVIDKSSTDNETSAIGGGTITSALLESLGISKEEGQAIFKNAEPSSIENGIYKTFSQDIQGNSDTGSKTKIETQQINNSQNTILKKDVNTIASTSQSPAKIVKDEPTKILSPASPKAEIKKPEEPTNTGNQAEIINSDTIKNESIPQKSESKESFAASETKNESSSRNEEGENINRQLLSVMQEILKTLKGPLIVSEDKPRFY